MRVLIGLILSVATGALAVSPGDKLYIRSKDTQVLKEPRTGAPAVATLQQGTEVIWAGVSEKDNQWHQVNFAGKKGFLQRSQLSPNRPQLELDSVNSRPMSGPAFANSGAVNKDAPPPYAQDPAQREAAAELIYVEQLNQTKATPAAIVAKNRELHAR